MKKVNEAPIAFDPQDPMNPMIHSHKGANPAKLKDRMLRAAGQLKDLAQRAQTDSAVSWEMIARNFDELAMNIEQIRHGIDELAKQRKKGGVMSKGIDKNIGEISRGDYHKKATMGRAMAQMSAGFAKSPEEKEKFNKIAARREKGLERSKARTDKFWAEKNAKDQADQLAKDKAELPQMMAQFSKLRAQFDPDYEYSDDYSYWTKQRDIRAQMGHLQNRIARAGGSVKEGTVGEWKKSTKAPIKPRNFVAKNATTSGAGAHKDKKKDSKQGKQKHKKKHHELAESATYNRRLNVLFEMKKLTEEIKRLKK